MMKTQTRTKRVDQLQDGDVFSIDNGQTWHICAVVLFGNVAVYINKRRDDNAPTIRIDAEREDMVLVR